MNFTPFQLRKYKLKISILKPSISLKNAFQGLTITYGLFLLDALVKKL